MEENVNIKLEAGWKKVLLIRSGMKEESDVNIKVGCGMGDNLKI
jgi:hypothetical protein